MIDFDRGGGLVAAIAQDADSGQVLMIAWMNREAFEETLRTRRAVYFSRSRNRLWRNDASGNHQRSFAAGPLCDHPGSYRQHRGIAKLEQACACSIGEQPRVSEKPP